MTRDEVISSAVSLAITVTQDGEVVSFDREVFKNALRLAGFAIVPLEPTDEMIRAGLIAAGALHVCQPVWDAMIVAYEKEQGDD